MSAVLSQVILFVVLAFALSGHVDADDRSPKVELRRIPDGGIQPQLVAGAEGVFHMVYYKGDAASGDIFYVHWQSPDGDFTEPVRVNSQVGSAIAAGTIRGAQLALGKHQRVHVAWNGSGTALPKGIAHPGLPVDNPYRLSAPMLYSRMAEDGTHFEAQRNLMTHTYALDGGGSLAADNVGNVFVVWHANSVTGTGTGEEDRAVWVAVSNDAGATFAQETRANVAATGACGCCGLRAYADSQGRVFVLYRSATDTIHRDMYLLHSDDRGKHFDATKLDDWEVPACVMSSASLLESQGEIYAAWETQNQVKFANVAGFSAPVPLRIEAPPPAGESRKHPVLARNHRGDVILVWTEGTGWQKGGEVAWQVFDKAGRALPGGSGHMAGIPVWSFAAVYAHINGDFTILY